MKKYLIILESTGTGFSVYSPDLPGCVATGSDRGEAERNMRDAITYHVDGLREDGAEVPEPSSTATYLEVAV